MLFGGEIIMQGLFGIIGWILGSFFVYQFKVDMRIMVPLMTIVGVLVGTALKKRKQKPEE